ncbi:MAG TPA: hypothetical protein VMV44_02580, partial [Rectinemataceae bacterium]|nr:hypothetical protein [Rectinemataceae bacterium]
VIGKSGRKDPAILLGTDTRPTGPTIADMMTRVFLSRGIRVHYLAVVAAPEIMAYSRQTSFREAGHEERAEAFCYISASHNPPAHNGVKFGIGGGVLPGPEINPLIASFRELVADPDLAARVFALVDEAEPRAVAAVYTACNSWKRRAVSAYTLFAREIVTGRADLDAQEELFLEMEAATRKRPLGVLADLNGSARCLSIDADFLGGLGLSFSAINDKPGLFVHRIVPEGGSLETAREGLQAAGKADAAYAIGYVPDCDGDRGNLVWRDPASGLAKTLEAQEVFALAVLAELALLERDGLGGKAAVAVNDATSLRIEAIARVFGAEVRRAETGEANVVGLAAELRREGRVVRILGEGSNGGNITHPSEVRDPLATLGAILKLLLLREGGSSDAETGKREGLFHIWLRRSGRLDLWRPDFDIGDIIASLPAYATTSVFEPRAALLINERDHASLKARYREFFLESWETRRAELKRRFGVTDWQAFATRASAEAEAGSDFAASGKGGLRIALLDGERKARGFLWMRGSGTEAVFRIMADIEGGRPSDEAWLLSWQEELVRAADRAS